MRHTKTNCAIGDLARDIKIDTEINHKWDYIQMRDHLKSHHACSGALDALETVAKMCGAFVEDKDTASSSEEEEEEDDEVL